MSDKMQVSTVKYPSNKNSKGRSLFVALENGIYLIGDALTAVTSKYPNQTINATWLMKLFDNTKDEIPFDNIQKLETGLAKLGLSIMLYQMQFQNNVGYSISSESIQHYGSGVIIPILRTKIDSLNCIHCEFLVISQEYDLSTHAWVLENTDAIKNRYYNPQYVASRDSQIDDDHYHSTQTKSTKSVGNSQHTYASTKPTYVRVAASNVAVAGVGIANGGTTNDDRNYSTPKKSAKAEQVPYAPMKSQNTYVVNDNDNDDDDHSTYSHQMGYDMHATHVEVLQLQYAQLLERQQSDVLQLQYAQLLERQPLEKEILHAMVQQTQTRYT